LIKKLVPITIETIMKSCNTHSRIIYGNPVETCEPYPRDYMSTSASFNVIQL